MSAMEVSIIQGNVGQEQKWNEQEFWPTLRLYLSMIEEQLDKKLVVLPEAAITTFPENISSTMKLLTNSAFTRGSTVLTGIPLHDASKNIYYNGIITLGANQGVYHKIHLLPFGEYLPCKTILRWLHRFLFIPMADFTSGGYGQPDITVDTTVIAPFICYEIAYADLLLRYLPRAGLIVTISDDSWFGDSIAQAQHLEIARMRSMEVGRYQIFANNRGSSAIIDSKGIIILKTEPFQRAVLNGKVFTYTGTTPWVAWGKYLFIFFILGFLGLFMLSLFLAKKQS